MSSDTSAASEALRAIGTIVTHYNNDTLKDYLAEIDSLKSQVKDLNLRLEKYVDIERRVMKIRDEADKILGSCDSVTMYEHLLVLLERLGIGWKMIEHLLHEGIAIVIGQVPTQAIYGETWEWCKHLNLLETGEGGVGDILTAYGYVRQPPSGTWPFDFGNVKTQRVYVRDNSMIVVYTGSYARHTFDFCNNSFDGNNFSIQHTYAVINRIHRLTSPIPENVQSDYLSQGFTFTSDSDFRGRIISTYPLDSPTNPFK